MEKNITINLILHTENGDFQKFLLESLYKNKRKTIILYLSEDQFYLKKFVGYGQFIDELKEVKLNVEPLPLHVWYHSLHNGMFYGFWKFMKKLSFAYENIVVFLPTEVGRYIHNGIELYQSGILPQKAFFAEDAVAGQRVVLTISGTFMEQKIYIPLIQPRERLVFKKGKIKSLLDIGTQYIEKKIA